jgi:hypothetical protein
MGDAYDSEAYDSDAYDSGGGTSDAYDSGEEEVEEITVDVQAIGGDAFVSQYYFLGDDSDQFLKAAPRRGSGVAEAYNAIVLQAIDEDGRAPILELVEVHNATVDGRRRLTTTEDEAEHCCMIYQHAAAEGEGEDPLGVLVDYLRDTAASVGMMHSNLHPGNVLYDADEHTLTMINFERMSFFNNVADLVDVVSPSDDTVLESEDYDDHKTFDAAALRAMDFGDGAENDPRVVYRYVPDVMALAMYIYSKVTRRQPEMATPLFRVLPDGMLIGSGARAADLPALHPFWRPLAEGMAAYAAYTEGMETTRDAYFEGYTASGTRDAKLKMESFLEGYADMEVPEVDAPDDDAGLAAELYTELFPADLEDAYSPRWRSVNIKEHRIVEVVSGGGARRAAGAQSALLLLTALTAYAGSWKT